METTIILCSENLCNPFYNSDIKSDQYFGYLVWWHMNTFFSPLTNRVANYSDWKAGTLWRASKARESRRRGGGVSLPHFGRSLGRRQCPSPENFWSFDIEMAYFGGFWGAEFSFKNGFPKALTAIGIIRFRHTCRTPLSWTIGLCNSRLSDIWAIIEHCWQMRTVSRAWGS
jgi:hypothetical protein